MRSQVAASSSGALDAQRAVPTARVDVDYLERSGERHTLADGATHLRAFLLRAAGGASALGAHVMVAAGGAGVAEATDAVQGPVGR